MTYQRPRAESPTEDAIPRFVAALAVLDQHATAETVRDLLISDGVTGTPGSCNTCPVARWLAQRVGVDTQYVSVDGENCELWSYFLGSDEGWRPLQIRYTPPAARLFINEFDALAVDDDPNEVGASLTTYLPLLDRGADDDTHR